MSERTPQEEARDRAFRRIRASLTVARDGRLSRGERVAGLAAAERLALAYFGDPTDVAALFGELASARAVAPHRGRARR